MNYASLTTKDFMVFFKRDYAAVRKLVDVNSKNDPVDDPLASFYEAKEIMDNLCEALRLKINSAPAEERDELKNLLGTCLLNLVSINMETEHFDDSAMLLNESAQLLNKPNKPKMTTTLINVYNNLAILCINREMPDEAKTLLLIAKKMYLIIKCTIQYHYGIQESPFSFGQFVTEGLRGLEEAYTLTVYSLADVFAQQRKSFDFAVFCHVALKRQLALGNIVDPIYWVRKALRASQSFALNNGFYQAKHHLVAASAVLADHSARLREEDNGEISNLIKLELCKETSADIAVNWVKYCVTLMTASRVRLEEIDDLHPADDVNDLSNRPFGRYEPMCSGSVRSLIFPYLDVSQHKNNIRDEFFVSHFDANDILVAALKWLDEAQEFYTIDIFPEDYIKLEQNRSTLYNNMAYFAEDNRQKIKMHKKRIDIIEALLEKINPELYMTLSRQLWLELGIVYCNIMDIKRGRLFNMPAHFILFEVEIINALCEHACAYFKLYLYSFKDENGQMPQHFEDKDILMVIKAYSMVARTSMNSMQTTDSTKIANGLRCYNACKSVINLCICHPDMGYLYRHEYMLAKNFFQTLMLNLGAFQDARNH